MRSVDVLAREAASMCGRVTTGRYGSILCFHGIADGESPGSPHVSAATLRSVIEAIRASWHIVPLGELVQRHRAGLSTRGLIALTFDDAYVSLYAPAISLLCAKEIPFTVFVTTDAASNGTSYWWDRADSVFQRASPAQWALFERSCGVPDSYRQGQPTEFGRLRPFRQWMLRAHLGRLTNEIDEALGRAEREVQVRTTQRSMTQAELAGLADHCAVTLAVHTCSHPVLPLLDDDQLVSEIASCHATLRERFTNVLPVLAAPFGLFDERTVRLARRAGMEATLTLGASTLASSSTDWLPRFCMCAGEPAWKVRLRVAGIAQQWQRWRYGQGPLYPSLPSATT